MNQKEGDYLVITTKNNQIKVHKIKVGKYQPDLSDEIADIFKDNPDDAERFAGAYAAVDLASLKTNYDLDQLDQYSNYQDQ